MYLLKVEYLLIFATPIATPIASPITKKRLLVAKK